MMFLSVFFIWVLFVHATFALFSKASPSRFLLANATATSSLPQNLTGCTFQVRPGDTLHSVAKSINVSMDFLAGLNPTADLSDPAVLQSTEVINIPCPGSRYKTFRPLNIAGCFFLYTIDSNHKSMQSLLLNPPDSIPGPFSLSSIWVANYQALPYSDGIEPPPAKNKGGKPAPPPSVDLTAPGEWKVGRVIFIPTCYHTGMIVDLIPVTRPKTGCKIDVGELGEEISIESLARKLRVSTSDLMARNAWKQDKGQLPSTIVSIPCPG